MFFYIFCGMQECKILHILLIFYLLTSSQTKFHQLLPVLEEGLASGLLVFNFTSLDKKNLTLYLKQFFFEGSSFTPVFKELYCKCIVLVAAFNNSLCFFESWPSIKDA